MALRYVCVCVCGGGALEGPVPIAQYYRNSLQQRCDVSDRTKPMDWERNVFRCHFVHQKLLSRQLLLSENAPVLFLRVL